MKKNISLILGLAIPVLLVGIIILAVYVPQMMLKPSQDFLYVVGQNKSYYSYGDSYSITDGRLTKTFNAYPQKDIDPSYQPKYPTVRLFIYEASTGLNKEVTYEQAKSLVFGSTGQSSDGFIFVGRDGYHNNGIFEIFGSPRERSASYLKKGDLRKKITLAEDSSNDYYYNEEVQFLAWIVK